MTSMEKVKERYPEAELSPWYAGGYDVLAPSNKPSPGYKRFRTLGFGVTERAAWTDAAKRMLRRRFPARIKVTS